MRKKSAFNIDQAAVWTPTLEHPWTGPLKRYKKAFTRDGLVDLFPSNGITIADIGCGPSKFVARPQDRVIGVDHASCPGVDIVIDLSQGKLPFEDVSLDFVYCSHFIEHITHSQRDCLMFEALRTLKPGGLMFFKVPHYCHYWRAAWDHIVCTYGACTAYALANASWYSKAIPFFHVIGVGLNYRVLGFTKATPLTRVINRLLNLSHRMSEMYLGYLLGGIEEVQFLLMKPVAE